MGSYVNSNLISGEQVIYETKLHWITFVSLKGILTLFIAPLIAYFTSEFAITNKRLIIKTGFISRNTFEMNHSKIESVNVNQSIVSIRPVKNLKSLSEKHGQLVGFIPTLN